MAVTLTAQAATPKLSGAFSIWKWSLADSNGNPYRSYGARVSLTITGDITLATDDTFTLSWSEANGADTAIVFTARTNPTTDTDLQAGLGGASTYLIYYQGIASKLSEHPLVGALFSIVVKQDGANYILTIEALDRSTDFTVDLNLSGIVTAGFSKTITAASLDNTPDDYNLSIDVFMGQSGEGFEKITSLQTQANDEGDIEIELSQVLSSALDYKLGDSLLPSISLANPQLSNNQRDYYLRWKEDYANDTENYVIGATKNVVFGVVGNDKKAAGFLSGISSANAEESILNNYSGVVRIFPNQKVFLNWFNWNNQTETPILRVDAFTDFGASIPVYHYNLPAISVAQNQIATFPIGTTELSLSSQVKRFKLFLNDLTDNARFLAGVPLLLEVDRAYYQESYEFIALNQFGLPESFICTGEASIEQTQTREISIQYKGFLPVQFQSNIDLNQVYIYRTGNIRKNELERIIKLLRYNRIYLIEGGAYVQLIINTENFQSKQINQFTFALSFEAVRAIKPN